MNDSPRKVADDAIALLRPGRARKRCLARMRNVLKTADIKGSHGIAADTVLRVLDEHRDPAPSAGASTLS